VEHVAVFATFWLAILGFHRSGIISSVRFAQSSIVDGSSGFCSSRWSRLHFSFS
jgi:hypothetical protein